MTFPLANDGSWAELHGPCPDGVPGPALFLDRDGVVIEEVPYLHKPEDVRLVSGTVAAMKSAKRAGYPVVLVTNQGGIGVGLYEWAEFRAVQDHIAALLHAEGVEFAATFASPYHPRGTPPLDQDDHPSRKPNPGMLLRAASMLPVDLAQSWIVGDRLTDLIAGRRAGLAGGLHIPSNHKDSDIDAARVDELSDGQFRAVKLSSADEISASLPWPD